MGVLKRKQESEAITFKLPAAWRLCKQIKSELEGAPRPGRKLNGRGSEPSTEKVQ